MQIADFALERFFARWEFDVRYILCASDLEAYPMRELLELADADTRQLWDELTLGYTESAGHPLLREELADLYETVEPEEVLTFVGAEEAIFLAMHALLGAGDHAVVVCPSYQSLHEVGRSTGADITLLPLTPRSWSLDVDAVAAALRPTTRVVVVNFPHSPTGALLERAGMQRLVELTESRGVTLFSDEVYRYLELDVNTRLPAAVDRGSRTLSMGVLSKAFALAGLRIGWIATHDSSLRQRIATLKDYSTICGSAPSEILGLVALRARDRVLARSRRLIETNLPHLDAFFARFGEHFEWVRPRAGSVAFPRLRSDEPGAIDRFCDSLVKAEQVLLAPGSVFGHPGNHFRIGFGRANMPAALERLEAFATRYFA